jgi:hypothetical protein
MVAATAIVPRRLRGRHGESRSTLTGDSLMESTRGAGQHGLQGVRLDLLRRAAGLYLDMAYPSGVIPEVVRRRLDWREDCPADESLARPPFERAGKTSGQPTPIYALRLGNHRYPHMKLQIQPWPNEAGFMLSVNTHDQVAGVNLSEVDAQAFRDLQAENQRLKEAIEQAWDEAGLPTFLRYLRDYIASRRGSTQGHDPDDRSTSGPDPSGQASLSE